MAARARCVHGTTADALPEQNRCHAGPTILFDRPRPGIPARHPSDFPCGPATLWRRVRGRCAMGAGRTLQSSPAYRYRRSGKRMRWKLRWRPGAGCVHGTTADALPEQSRCHAGPTMIFEHSTSLGSLTGCPSQRQSSVRYVVGRSYPTSFGRCMVTPCNSVRNPAASILRYARCRPMLTPATSFGRLCRRARPSQARRSCSKFSAAFFAGRTVPKLHVVV
jgi:hypothetical protein